MTCSIEGCERIRSARGWCRPHYIRWRTHGDVQAHIPIRADRNGPNNPNWSGDDVTYKGFHHRLRLHRGRAADHVCAMCGEKPAEQWSYDYSDPDEKMGMWQGRMTPYSLDMDRYTPLCVKCHNARDWPEKYSRRGMPEPPPYSVFAPIPEETE